MNATPPAFGNKRFLVMAFAITSILSTALPNCHSQTPALALHSFSKTFGPNATNEDGASPAGRPVLIGTNLYGTASLGGHFRWGTLFRVSTNGADFAVLHHFGAGSDGELGSFGGLVVCGDKLFGAASAGAANFAGGIYSINTDGTGYTNFYSFSLTTADPNQNFTYTNSDGSSPFSGVLVADGRIYGTTTSGGRFGAGTIFSLSTNGTGFTTLHDFTSVSGSVTNRDGLYAFGTLILSGNTLYGLAKNGGSNGLGTIFSLSTNGGDFTVLHHFGSSSADGLPYGSLVLADNVLYGSTIDGGGSTKGTVFKINADGSDFTTLYEFPSEFPAPGGIHTNAVGGSPYSSLVLSHSTLVGVAGDGGIYGGGTVFTINTNGNNFFPVHQFGYFDVAAGTNAEGVYPNSGVILSGDTLYGAASLGGAANQGTIFAVSLPVPPSLTISLADTNVLVSWPAAAAGFQLQSTADLLGSWNDIRDQFDLIDANFVFSSPATDPQIFFRLQR